MANARGKHIDTTDLSIDQAETRGFLHRDYIAHCFRWSHVIKNLYQSGRYQTARILDVGCGRDVPLAKTLYSSRLIVSEYIGVDYNKHEGFDLSAFHTGKFPINTFGRVDFASDQVWFDKAQDGRNLINIRGDNGEDYFTLPNVITCFEVMEHIEPYHVRASLAKFAKILNMSKQDGENPVMFMSTPNYDPNVGHAANHVNEMKHEALGWAIEDAGLSIKEQYGTFASQRDYKHKLFGDLEGSREIYDRLSRYYDSNVMATIFAPLYPAEARNCIWVLGPTEDNYERRFSTLDYDETKPWTSSEHWRDLSAFHAQNEYDPTVTGA